mmetsp:Transcript_128462/g.181174  ORF Transcript_128462/g.181174 Transcript_128462/m.181174 type:complete len:157 (+) Transcript_128462:65-535(+)|eukprot:s8986_g1.t1
MRKYLLFLVLILSLTWDSALGQEDEEPIDELEEDGGIEEEEDEVPDIDDEDMGELEDMPDQGLAGKMSNHPQFQDCMEHAEAVEAEHGLYDNGEVGEDGRKALAAALKAKAAQLKLKDSPAFESAFLAKLEEVHSSRGGFGASDACDFLLEHHEEL